MAKKIFAALNKISGPIGLFVAAVTLGIEVYLGDTKNILLLKSLVCSGIALWIWWVSSSLISLQKSPKPNTITTPEVVQPKTQKENSSDYNVVLNYNGGDLFQWIRPENGWDAKNTPWANKPVAKIEKDKHQIVIERLHESYRYIMGLYRYIDPESKMAKDYVPPILEGRIANDGRYLMFSLIARSSGNQAHRVTVRVRRKTGDWMTILHSHVNAECQLDILTDSYRTYLEIIGPFDAKEEIYVTIELSPGPTGKTQTLLINKLVLAVSENKGSFAVFAKQYAA